MAHITYHEPVDTLPRRFFSRIGSMLSAFGRAVVINSSAEARLREISRLQSLSDAELSAKGIQRDRIVHHVFRDIYMI